MKCPKCDFVQSDRNARCSKCGLIFEKDLDREATSLWKRVPHVKEEAGVISDGTFWGDVIFFVEPEVNLFHFAGRGAVFLVLFVWGWIFVLNPMASNYAGRSFLHLVNLPFHEAGHVFFQIFGRWMTSLGGTLGQLLIPLICLSVFLLKSRNPFGAAACLWWFGESFLDIAPYINDARKGELMLLGGVTGKEADYGYHDWEFILSEIGLLRCDQMFARLAHGLGVLLVLLSLAWAGYLLYKQYKNLDLS